jgi:hypothetical protein
MTKTAHPWIRLQAAIRDGDKEQAEAILREDGLTGSRRVAAYSAVKKAFPPEPGELKSAEEKQAEQDEAGNNSAVAAALQRRRESRQKRVIRGKPSIGWNVPPEDGVEYRQPNVGGFNTPA